MYVIKDLQAIYNYPDELWKMLNSLDIITLNHSVRVCEICRIVEKELGFKDTSLSEAGLFHDIGKFFITTKLLNKRGGLTDIERGIIDSHSYFSYKILLFYDISSEISLLALYHHKLDPVIFMDDDITLGPVSTSIARRALILKTVDMFEALTTDRPYHRGIDYLDAINIIEEGEYDKETIEIIKKHHKEIE